METHIKAIIEEDLKAQETYRQAEAKIAESLANIHKEKTRIQDEVWDKAKKHVELEKEKLTQQLQADQAVRQKIYEKALNELESKFNLSKDEWRKRIFDRCVQRGQ